MVRIAAPPIAGPRVVGRSGSGPEINFKFIATKLKKVYLKLNHVTNYNFHLLIKNIVPGGIGPGVGGDDVVDDVVEDVVVNDTQSHTGHSGLTVSMTVQLETSQGK